MITIPKIQHPIRMQITFMHKIPAETIYRILIRSTIPAGIPFSIILFSHYPLRRKITCIQLIILTFRRDQLIMRTSLDDASLLHDHDTVGVLDC